MTTAKPLSHMTPLQQMTAKQKVIRLNRINQYYQDNDDASINQAVKYTPLNGESAALVQQYSKLRTEIVTDGHQVKITPKDIDEYVYGVNPCRHRQKGR